MEETAKHEVRMENRKSLVVGGVGDVLSFSEEEVRLSVSGGVRLTVTGEGMKMLGFDKRTGEARLCGTVKSLVYRDGVSAGKRKIFR